MTQNIINLQGGQQYESPAVEVMDIVSEGVFCNSATKINPWQNDGNGLDF